MKVFHREHCHRPAIESGQAKNVRRPGKRVDVLHCRFDANPGCSQVDKHMSRAVGNDRVLHARRAGGELALSLRSLHVAQSIKRADVAMMMVGGGGGGGGVSGCGGCG